METEISCKEKIKSYLREITDETAHLYMSDEDCNARLAGEGYYRSRIAQVRDEAKKTKKVLSKYLFETVIGVSVTPKVIGGRHKFEVTQFNIASALEKVWKIKFNPRNILMLINQGGKVKKVEVWQYEVNDLVDRYISDKEIRTVAKGQWDLLYHSAELDLGDGFTVNFRFFIAEN